VVPSNDFLRLNVGFIIHQTVGYARDIPLEAPAVILPPDLNLNQLNGTVRVTRTAQGLLLQARVNALTTVECVRCLEQFEQELEAGFTELYAFNQNSVTESGLILPEDGKINLAPLLREELLLAIPIGTVCRPTCRGLCPVCGENLNLEECLHVSQPTHPDTSP
jgi:uncharacterized protein